jgi:nucleoside phosphorylase
VIAAADTLLKNAATRDVLRDRFGARAVEMEASGVQNAAWHQGKDIFVVRGICDYCDSVKNDDWQKYAALVAAAYARALVEAMPSSWF